jgi:ribokinase
VEAMRPLFAGARLALFQLESPIDTVAAALRLAREEGARTILDPAPAQPLPAALLAEVDILTPNESEALLLLSRPPGRVELDEAPALARFLAEMGPRAVILKLGERGCFYRDSGTELFSAAFSVTPRDTTAAGDVFNAALAVALAEDLAIEDALRFANAAAAISVTRAGAQASVPSRAEVGHFLSDAGSQ